MAVVTVAQVRERLNKTLTVDDGEIADMIDAAEAEYADWVGPLAGRTLRYNGGGTVLTLPVNATAVTAVSYTDGTTVNVADFDFDPDTGLLHWGYNTAGYFPAGSRNVLVTFTVTVPANHLETIVADVAGYFASTQRGSNVGALPGGYEAGYEDRSTPVVLFPRIRALAGSFPGVA